MALKTTQTATNTSDAVEIAASNLGRRSAVIKNADASNALYFGQSSAVSDTNGFPLAAGESVSLFGYTGDIFAIADVGTPTACVLEVVEDQ